MSIKMEFEDVQKEESEHVSDDKSDIEDEIVDAGLYLRLDCAAFCRCPGLKTVLKEFFDSQQVEAPLVRKSECYYFQKVPDSLYLLMNSREDKQRLLNLRQEWAVKLHNSPVNVHDVACSYDLLENRYPEGVSTALDILMPYRSLPYDSQVKIKMEHLKDVIIGANDSMEALLVREKRLGERYFPFLPTFHDPIKVAFDTHHDCNFVDINFEYNEKTNQAAAGLNVTYTILKGVGVGAPRRLTTFVPIEMCSHIALPIIKVTESFVQYLNSNLDSLGEYKAINPDTKTGLVNRLNATSNEKGEVLLTVLLSYSTTFDEMVPLDEVDDKVMLPDVWRMYMDSKNQELGNSDKFTDKSKTAYAEAYKFIIDRYKNNSAELLHFDFEQAESHLDIMHPLLKRFFDENKDSLNLVGIYVNWYNISKRPSDWNRRMATFHHVCGSRHIENVVADVVLRRIPLEPTNEPLVPNYGELLTIILKKLDVNESTPLVLFSKYLSLCIFFAKKVKNLMVVDSEKCSEKLPNFLKRLTGNEVTFIGEDTFKMDSSFRKLSKPYESLVAWGHTIRKQTLERLIVLGVKRIALVIEQVIVGGAAKGASTTKWLTRIHDLVYPHLTLAEVIPVECEPGGCHFSVIALYEVNKEAPSLPPVEFELPKEPEFAAIHRVIIKKKSNYLKLKQQRKRLRKKENKKLMENEKLTDEKERTEREIPSANIELMDILELTELEDITVMRPAGDCGGPAAKRGRGAAPARGRGASPAFGHVATTARGRGAFPAFGHGAKSASTEFGRGATPSPGRGATPAFGHDVSPEFGHGATRASGRGASPAFGHGAALSCRRGTSPPFEHGATRARGCDASPAFGEGATPSRGCGASLAFGHGATPSHGRGASPAFGHGASPEFGHGATRARGRNASPAFGQGATPSRGRGASPAFGHGASPEFGHGASPEFGHGASRARGRDASPAFGHGSTPSCGRGASPAVELGATPARGRGASPAFGHGATPARGRGASPAFGHGAKWARGRGASPAFELGATPARGRGASPAFGHGAKWARGCGASLALGHGATPARGRGASPVFGHGAKWARGRGASLALGHGATLTRGLDVHGAHVQDYEPIHHSEPPQPSWPPTQHWSPHEESDERPSGSFSHQDQGGHRGVADYLLKQCENLNAMQKQLKEMISTHMIRQEIDGWQAGNPTPRGPPRNIGRSGRPMDDYNSSDFTSEHHLNESRCNFAGEDMGAGSNAQHYPTESSFYDIPGRHGGGRVGPYDQDDLHSRRSNPYHGNGTTGYGEETEEC